MKKQTAAEKFDLVPPWLTVTNVGGASAFIIAHDSVSFAASDGSWCSFQHSVAREVARAAARLTRPLDSWEPAPDCALPVEGWIVDTCFGGWGVFPDRAKVRAMRTFHTRAAAYVWAWTEAEHTDGPVATDGPDDRGTLGWPAFDELCTTVDGWATNTADVAEGLASLAEMSVERIEKAELQIDGIIARIGPMESFVAEAQALANRLTIVERLVAAQVPVPAKVNVRSDAASTNEAMTEAAASDEGWREMLVPIGNTWTWWMTPDGKYESVSSDDATCGWEEAMVGRVRRTRPVSANDIAVRAELPPPPNLAEWWKPGTKATTESGDDAAHRFAKALVAAREAVPPTYRVGDDLAAWVRNLASAHETALKVQAELRAKLASEQKDGGRLYAENKQLAKDLAAAQTAATAAEGRAATAKRHAADAEAKLAELRADIENVRASLGK